MARSRKIKRSRKQKKSSFLPDSLQAFIARRLVDIVALVFLSFALFAFASLFSYDSTDPSWNTATDDLDGSVSNIGSMPGAYMSDILLQTLGLGAFVPALCFLIWGVRIYKRQSVRPVLLRVASILMAAVTASIALASVPSGAWFVHPYLGSATGAMILEQTVATLDLFSLPYASVLVVSLAGICALGFFLYGAAFKGYEIASLWFRVKVAGYTLAGMTMSLVQGFYNWVMHYNSPDYETTSSYSGIMEKLRVMKEDRAIATAERRAAWEAEKEKIKKATMKRPVPQADNMPDRMVEEAAPVAASALPVSSAPPSGSISIPVVKPQQASTKPQSKAKDSSQQRFALSDVDGEWEFPPVSLIQEVPPEVTGLKLNEDALRKNAELLRTVLEDFNIKGDIVSIHPGPVVTLYELEPAPGTKTSRVISLSDDIARSMSAISVRCAVVPGRNVIGIELPNKTRQTVYMKEMLQSRLYEKTSAKLPLILGKDIGGQPILADLAKMPHLLVAGTTGSGKSVAVNTMIMSLLYRMSPEKCRFIMIDPKMLELSVYDDIPHLLTPVVTEPGKAIVALKWAVKEMEDRYRNMSKLGVRNVEGYNQRIREAIKNDEKIMHKVQTGFDPDNGKPTFEDREMPLAELPYIVIIVDEFADLMLVAGKDVENAIQRLAQMARAAGLHLIMATQRPSVDVITGVVKANFPTRISFQVTSKIDSRTILGDSGAEQLLGMGDMLYMAPGGRITRVHGPFVSDEDVEKAANFLRAQAKPAYIEDVISEDPDFGGSEVMNAMFGDGESDNGVDELYDKAVAIITREGKVSTSFIQRHLQIGYNRAARIVEEMERQGVISQANSAGKRQILVNDHSRV
tara:strand:- start:8873 stop:11446 length:2574 start_codon:yes stop_codon:yes gene_type:complete